MIFCDAVETESKRGIFLCYKLQEQFSEHSDKRKELFNLGHQLKANTVKITAANFFRINKTTLFTIFGTTATYFIVLVQFN
jgi:gustatory receptor